MNVAGHALELARAARVDIALDWARVPLLAGVRALVGRGFVTGAASAALRRGVR